MTTQDLPHGTAGRHGVSARTRLLTSLIVGVVIGAGVSVPGTWRYGLLLGWISAAAVFIGWTWISIWPMDAQRTAAHAAGENPGRALTDVVMLGAAVASLLAVGLLLSGGSGNKLVVIVLPFRGEPFWAENGAAVARRRRGSLVG